MSPWAPPNFELEASSFVVQFHVGSTRTFECRSKLVSVVSEFHSGAFEMSLHNGGDIFGECVGEVIVSTYLVGHDYLLAALILQRELRHLNMSDLT